MTTQLYPHVTADPNILAGIPVVEGTSVPVSPLVAQVAKGKCLDEVAREPDFAVTCVTYDLRELLAKEELGA